MGTFRCYGASVLMLFGMDYLWEDALAIPTQRTAGVGFSKNRTPAKHCLMCKLYGREIAVVHKNPSITDSVWYDQSAGDGVAALGGEWIKNCSPGILAYYARYPERIGGRLTGRLLATKPVRLELFEKSDAIYALLLDNLARELPNLGYEKDAEDDWSCGPVRLRVHNRSGAEADLSLIGPNTAVRVNNDPNKISDWVMPPNMPGDIRKITPWFLGICTMGCNVGGLKRLLRDHPEEAERWYALVRSVQTGLPRHHDLYLCAIDRDASQWAYLIIAPKATQSGTDWKASTQRDAASCFEKQGMKLRDAWLRDNQPKFNEILDYLFTIQKDK